MKKKTNIRNSTAEFLIFTGQSGENNIEVRVTEDTVWLTQKSMSTLFEVTIPTINEHLSNLFSQKEIPEKSNYSEFPNSSKRRRSRESQEILSFTTLKPLSLSGFESILIRALQFRQWAVSVLKDFAMRGYVLDKERLKNGAFFDKTYFDNLIEEIREIRASERRFYQKITDIYATVDYKFHKNSILL